MCFFLRLQRHLHINASLESWQLMLGPEFVQQRFSCGSGIVAPTSPFGKLGHSPAKLFISVGPKQTGARPRHLSKLLKKVELRHNMEHVRVILL